jgi:hypothetical protein
LTKSSGRSGESEDLFREKEMLIQTNTANNMCGESEDAAKEEA